MQFPSDRAQNFRCVEVKDLALLKPAVKSISIDASLKNPEDLSERRAITRVEYFGVTMPRPIAQAISSAPNLIDVRLMGLREIEHPIRSKTLATLHLRHCPGLQDFRFLRGSPAVHTIWTLGCKQLSSLRGLERLPELQVLEIQGSLSLGTLESLKPLKKLTDLVMLSIASRVADKSLAGIAAPALERLWLDNFFSTAEYEGVLKRCPRLKRIELHNGVYSRKSGFKKDND